MVAHVIFLVVHILFVIFSPVYLIISIPVHFLVWFFYLKGKGPKHFVFTKDVRDDDNPLDKHD